MSLLVNLPLREKQNLLLEYGEWLVKQAETKGVSAVQISARIDSGLDVQTRFMELEHVEYSQDQAMSVQVYYGKRVGSASCNCLEKRALSDALDAACASARCVEPDPFAGLPEAGLLVNPNALPDLDLLHPCKLEVEQLFAMCQAVEQAGFDYSKQVVNSEGASFEVGQSMDLLMMKSVDQARPFVVCEPTSSYALGCALVAGEDAADRQVGYWFDQAVDHDQLMTPASVGVMAAERAVKALGARPLSTARLPVLFDPGTAKSLLKCLLQAISGKRIYEKTSFLAQALGRQVFSDGVSLCERPFIARAMGSAAFDAEGVATSNKSVIDKGQLSTYLLSSYTGRMLAMPSTGNAGGVHNLVVEAPTQPLADMIKQIDRGLLVTELMGQGINLVTGDYSRGASGYWIEDGVVSYPVHEFTVAGNLADIFRQMVAFGDDVDLRTSVRTGSILVESMQVAGTN